METKPLGMKIKCTKPIRLAERAGLSVTQNQAEREEHCLVLMAVERR